ncbi:MULTISPECIES: hypothetical protein [Amycolatopsis]|uniref:Uncharacterized protein n=2 Tax=Amycolatopsis TaxID=1813 RepID=A0A1I4CNV7_9PSEU|nr:hypothetical protein [Amycolatopsis sacchari]SFK81621.1 hypothetical protein SAMN05421835_13555 [Amycolatopsis sacchari]
MAKPSPLQLRNLVLAVLMLLAGGWNLWRGGPWWLTAIFGVGCVLAVASAFLNRPAD